MKLFRQRAEKRELIIKLHLYSGLRRNSHCHVTMLRAVFENLFVLFM